MPETRFRVLYLPSPAEARLSIYVTPRENAFTFYVSSIEKDSQEKLENIDVGIFVQQGEQREMPVFRLNSTYLKESDEWLAATVDLSRWEGADIDLLVRTIIRGISRDPTQGTRSFQSQITVERLPSLAELWQDLDWDAQLLVGQGDRERQRGRPVSALRWYKQAVVLEPGGGYIWERLGRVYEEETQWNDALAAYQRLIDSDNHEGIASLARIYTRMAAIQRWHLGETDPVTIKSYLSGALHMGDFLTPYEEADTHYKLAHVLWEEGASEDALRHLQLAVQSDPTYIWARVLLGWLLYRVRGDVSGAEQQLRLALDLGAAGRQAYWAYRHLGVINWNKGREAEAIAMFENALRADPSSGQTLAQLIEETTGESWSK